MQKALPQLLISGQRLPFNLHAIRASGSDAFRFLQGQVTSDLKKLETQPFVSSCVLDNAARIVAHFYVARENDSYLLLAQAEQIESLLLRLDKFLIADDVSLSKISQQYQFVLKIGEQGRVFNLPANILPLEQANTFSVMDDKLFHQIVFHSGEALDASQYLNVLINDTVYVDLCVGTNKGCYLGQETVAKIESRRGAAKKWVRLELEKQITDPVQSITIDQRQLQVLDWLNDHKKTYLKVGLMRELRVEGKRIPLEIEAKTTTAKVHYFPISLWDFDQWAQEQYLQAVQVFHSGDEAQAIHLLEQLIQIKPDFEDAYESMAVILGRQEKFDQAIDVLKRLEQINPDLVMVHTNLSLNYMKLGQIEKAEEHKSIATVKSFEVFGKEAQARRDKEEQIKKKQEEDQRREQMFIQVLEIDPEDSLANYGMGEIEYDRGNLEKAQNYLQIALTADPKYSLAYLKLAEVLLGQGRQQQARETLEKGIQIASNAGNLMPANQMQRMLDSLN